MPEQLMQNAFQNHSTVSADPALGLFLLSLKDLVNDDLALHYLYLSSYVCVLLL